MNRENRIGTFPTVVSRTPRPARGLAENGSVERRKFSGQAIIIVALVLTVLMLFIGLGVDVAMVMSKQAKLQSAVDSSALSAAQVLYNGTQAAATVKAKQIIEASGVPSSTLVAPAIVGFPGPNQVSVEATQRVDTYFMRLIPAWSTLNITVDAVADASSFAEILAKPYGRPGVVSELNLMVWGVNSRRHNGDAYSPARLPSYQANTVNPYYEEQPYGYLFRIDVPADFPDDEVVLQIFDADSYNRSDYPSPTATVRALTPTPTPGPDYYAACRGASGCTVGTDDSSGPQHNTGVKLDGFADDLPAFWRVDEVRPPYNTSAGDDYINSYLTDTDYTLWHFDPRITTAFDDPVRLSDYPASGTKTYVARFQSRLTNASKTDLRWYQPPGFRINLNNFEPESHGGWYFYLYVRGVNGSSENNYDLRVGPPQSEPGRDCTDEPASPYSSPCYVNKIYWNQVRGGTAVAWNDGGATVFAKRSLPLNLVTGSAFPLTLAQISKNAAGQTLYVKHFDQDCNNGCGTGMQYQLSKCIVGRPINFESNSSDWVNISMGYVGPGDNGTLSANDGWYCTQSQCRNPETVQIPPESDNASSLYRQVFYNGATSCDTSWLRIKSYPSYSQDTTVWLLPFVRPRLIE